MKRLLTGILLAGVFTVCSGQILVPVPGSGVYIDPDTNKIYPGIAPNIAIDPETNEVITSGSRRREPKARAGQASQARTINCTQLQAEATQLRDILGGMGTDDPRYAPLYYRMENAERLHVYQCE